VEAGRTGVVDAERAARATAAAEEFAAAVRAAVEGDAQGRLGLRAS